VTSTQRISAQDSNQVDVVTLFRTIRNHPYIVTATTVATVAFALYLALTATPIFRAEVVVTQAREQNLGGLANQYSGLASLAGLNLGAASGAERDDKAILRSHWLAEEFVKRPDVWAVLQGQPTDSKIKRTVWSTVLNFRKNVLIITEDKTKGVTSISIDWTDPATAARWANEFVAMANELVRKRAIDESSRNIEYLKKQIAGTNVLEMQHVMYDIIESETKTLMLANARTEYAFTVVDPAVAPEVRISPRRTLMVASGFAIGLFLGSLLALIYNMFRPHAATRPMIASGA
jgi:uncharacterized protein involved in exopolysaccharide biosynthesis